MSLRQALRAARPVLLGLVAVWVVWAAVILHRTPAAEGWPLLALAEGPTLVLGLVALIVVNWVRGRRAER